MQAGIFHNPDHTICLYKCGQQHLYQFIIVYRTILETWNLEYLPLDEIKQTSLHRDIMYMVHAQSVWKKIKTSHGLF